MLEGHTQYPQKLNVLNNVLIGNVLIMY